VQNFTRLFQNSAFLMAAKNTLQFSAIAVPLAVVLAILMALMLEARIPLKSQFRTFFLSPMMVPIASVVLIWQVIFHYNGALNSLLSHFGVDPIDWLKSGYSQLVIVLLFLWKNLGYDMILCMAALSGIPREQLEAAEVDGAGPWKRFWKIKLRYISPSLLFVTILSLINSFKIFREVYLLTGKYPYESLYMLQHFMNNTFLNIDYQKLSAAAIIMFTVMLIIIGILFLIEARFGKDVEQ
jgi:multiple sugar transport system permease protein